MRKQAFTLVELLVVIGIIALLISILLPVLTMARRSAQSLVCLSNLRQLGTAAFLYANDHQGRMVPHAVFDTSLEPIPNGDPNQAKGANREWCFGYTPGDRETAFKNGLLAKYMSNVTAIAGCPAYETPQGFDPYPMLAYPAIVHYGYNGLLLSLKSADHGTNGNWTGLKLGSFKRNSEIITFACSAEWKNGMAVPQKDLLPPIPVKGPPTTLTGPVNSAPSIHARHGRRDRANVAWADGHVTSEVVSFYKTLDPVTSQLPQSAATLNARIGFLEPHPTDNKRDNAWLFVK